MKKFHLLALVLFTGSFLTVNSFADSCGYPKGRSDHFEPRLIKHNPTHEPTEACFFAYDIKVYCLNKEGKNKDKTAEDAKKCRGAALRLSLMSQKIGGSEVYYSLPGESIKYDMHGKCLLHGGPGPLDSANYEISNTKECLGEWFEKLNSESSTAPESL